MVCGVSAIPAAPDVLAPEVELIPIPEVAKLFDRPATRVHQLVREGQLLAVWRDGELSVPSAFLADATIVKGLPGTITLLNDAGYHPEEILRWLFTEDDTLPGSPIQALRENRGREVKRRAQAMGF